MSGTEDRRQRIRSEALHRLALLGETAEEVVRLANEAAGGDGPVLARARPSVLDAAWPDLRRMSWQCSNFEAAIRLLRPLMENTDSGRSLGAVLKTADPAVTEDVRRHLVEAGVLPAEETR